MSTENGTPSNHAIPYFICQPSVPVGFRPQASHATAVPVRPLLWEQAPNEPARWPCAVGTVKVRGRIVRRYHRLQLCPSTLSSGSTTIMSQSFCPHCSHGRLAVQYMTSVDVIADATVCTSYTISWHPFLPYVSNFAQPLWCATLPGAVLNSR